VYDLLMDDPRLTEERAKAEKLREKISSVSNETVDFKLRSSLRTDDPPVHVPTRTPAAAASPPPTSISGHDDWEAQPVEEPKAEEAKVVRAKKPKKVRAPTDGTGVAVEATQGSATQAYSARVAPPTMEQGRGSAAPPVHHHQQQQQQQYGHQAQQSNDPFGSYDDFGVSTPAPSVRPAEVDFMSSVAFTLST
jgi:hypothetical protein